MSCYAYRCAGDAAANASAVSPNRVEIRGPDGVWRPCAAGGLKLAAGGAGFTGTVTCPPDSDLLCARACFSGPCAAGPDPAAV